MFPNLPTLKSAKTTTTTALAVGLTSLASLSGFSQSYVAVDLTPQAVNAVAKGVEGAAVGGLVAPTTAGGLTRATVWDADGPIDLHPALLADPATGTAGRSGIEDIAEGLQVGWGAGTPTSNRTVPMAWRDSAESGTILDIPFVHLGGQAWSTDGTQIVGYAIELNSGETTVTGTSHAIVWDAATGTATDLGDGGKGAQAVGVGGGIQVGYINKGIAVAALWRGSRGTQVDLNPKNAVVSMAAATDGARQVGYAGYDIRVRAEAAKGNKNARFNYAMVWTGSAASAVNIHPYPINAGNVVFNNSYALGVSGSRIVGYATDPSKLGNPAYQHAIVWDENFESVDLNAFLPAGFVGSIAYSVDANGTIAGVMTSADGRRHAVAWYPTAPQN